MTEEGDQFRIGDQVHAFLADGHCGIGWITEWDEERGTASVQGFRRPHEERLTSLLVNGLDVGYLVPASSIVAGPPEDPPLITSFHRRSECPWDR